MNKTNKTNNRENSEGYTTSCAYTNYGDRDPLIMMSKSMKESERVCGEKSEEHVNWWAAV